MRVRKIINEVSQFCTDLSEVIIVLTVAGMYIQLARGHLQISLIGIKYIDIQEKFLLQSKTLCNIVIQRESTTKSVFK